MKTEPTDIDREAAGLFTASHGMRVWRAISPETMSSPSLVIEAEAGPGVGVRTELGWSWFRICAIDTDDPATVGQMLAQVEALRPGQAVSIVDRLRSLPGEDERRFAVLVEHDGAQTVTTGPTRGAALVEAMKALKSPT